MRIELFATGRVKGKFFSAFPLSGRFAKPRGRLDALLLDAFFPRLSWQFACVRLTLQTPQHDCPSEIHLLSTKGSLEDKSRQGK
jgi:hypothetical protein